MFFKFLKNLHYYLIITSLLFLVACDSSQEQKKDTSKPVFTSKSKISIKENSKAVLTVETSDSSAVTLAITGGDDKAKFTIGSKGKLSFKFAPDFESPTDKDKKNTYIIIISATDSSENNTSQTITVLVEDIDETNPSFTSTNIKTIVEGKTEVVTVKATDNSNVTYAITSGQDKDKFSIDNKTGKLSFKVAPNFDSPTDTGGNNSYIVTITAVDTSNNSATQAITIYIIDDVISMSGDYTIKHLGKGPYYNNLDLLVNLGNVPKTLYILFTNHSNTTTHSPAITHNKKVISNSQKLIKPVTSPQLKISHASENIRNFNMNSHKLFTKQKNIRLNSFIPQRHKTVLGDSENFTTDIYINDPNHNDGDIKTTTQATVRKVVSNIGTSFGEKTLYIWVSDDSFDDDNNDGTDCDKHNNAPNISAEIRCVTPLLIDALADKFIKQGNNNDTYDWVTNIYGEEWGPPQFSNLIEDTDEISILLTDINNNNNPNGGVIGFFYSKDNFKKTGPGGLEGSNAKVMFYIDSLMFANDGGGGKWQKAVYATLAHEFTHMIEYYQKKTESNTWLAEMTAEATEYITSNKVEHSSPRGLPFDDGSAGFIKNTYDRYPDYVANNNKLSLTTFNNRVEDYSQVSAFGAFLVNNYGGPELLRDIMRSQKSNEEAVVEAVNKYKGNGTVLFGEILRDWGTLYYFLIKVI